jgi:hypothetical protein
MRFANTLERKEDERREALRAGARTASFSGILPLMKLAWLTDPHLNFIGPSEIDALAQSLRGRADAALITGDIGEADSFAGLLSRFAASAELPLWFVLGNHDAYRGSLSGMRAAARTVPGWLPLLKPIPIGEGTVLVGHDGWYDARLGDPEGSPVQLNDFYLIKELAGLSRAALLTACRRLGDQAALEVDRQFTGAIATGARTIVFATHVPPWAEACWHEGKISDAAWLPWFTCLAIGQVLDRTAAAHPEIAFLVLCGHTHGAGRARRAANLEVVTGGATYGAPAIAGLIVDGRFTGFADDA